jgi:hypothetical protein
MRRQLWKQLSTNNSLPFYLKCGAILLLFLLSVLIVACGGSGTDDSLGQPQVTVTINLNQNGSPMPPLPAYSCSAWVNNTSPGLNTPVIGVYAKYIHNVNGNPEGVGQVPATATVDWYDGNPSVVNATTTSDGLAVFSVSTANRSADLDKIIRVSVTFQASANAPSCTVDGDRAAYFSLVIATGVSGSPASSPVASPTAHATGTPCIPPAFLIVTPTVLSKKTPTPLPTPPATFIPTPTGTPCHP